MNIERKSVVVEERSISRVSNVCGMSGNRFFTRRGTLRARKTTLVFVDKKRMAVSKRGRNYGKISKDVLLKLYIDNKKSMQEIAELLDYSLHKIAYWMKKHNIVVRSRSDAMYIKRNPDGDPFKVKQPKSIEEAKLFGLGLGLYWGEGTKASLSSVRLGNTDPGLIKKFIEYLVDFFSVNILDLKFALQIFTDINPEAAMDFWIKKLKISKEQFNKPIITKSGSLGTYRKKSEYGVLTVMYHNKKLRNIIVQQIEGLKYK